jgi:hypothetical protein
MADTKIKLERKYIDLDTPYVNVVEWAEEGHTLVFLSKPELFLELTPEQVKDLPQRVKTSYNLAKGDWKTQTKAVVDPDLEFLNASIEYGSATEQLAVDQTKIKGKKIKWIRPEQVKEFARKGWGVVKENLDSQRGLREEGYHMVGKRELILVEIDEKRYAANEKQKQALHTQLFEANADEMKQTALSMGAKGSFETSSENINIPLS